MEQWNKPLSEFWYFSNTFVFCQYLSKITWIKWYASPKFYKNTYKPTDLILEVTPPEVGHLNRGARIKQKPKKSGPISTNLGFFELCLRQAELKQVSFLKKTNYTNITVHFLFFFSCSLDTEGDTSNPICRVFWKVCMVISDKFV